MSSAPANPSSSIPNATNGCSSTRADDHTPSPIDVHELEKRQAQIISLVMKRSYRDEIRDLIIELQHTREEATHLKEVLYTIIQTCQSGLRNMSPLEPSGHAAAATDIEEIRQALSTLIHVPQTPPVSPDSTVSVRPLTREPRFENEEEFERLAHSTDRANYIPSQQDIIDIVPVLQRAEYILATVRLHATTSPQMRRMKEEHDIVNTPATPPPASDAPVPLPVFSLRLPSLLSLPTPSTPAESVSDASETESTKAVAAASSSPFRTPTRKRARTNDADDEDANCTPRSAPNDLPDGGLKRRRTRMDIESMLNGVDGTGSVSIRSYSAPIPSNTVDVLPAEPVRRAASDSGVEVSPRETETRVAPRSAEASPTKAVRRSPRISKQEPTD